jgi:hypothetical protein
MWFILVKGYPYVVGPNCAHKSDKFEFKASKKSGKRIKVCPWAFF